MKKIVFALIAVLMYQYSSSQEKLGRPFFAGDVNFTLGINENYQIGPDDGHGP
jgi:hypothetical protein